MIGPVQCVLYESRDAARIAGDGSIQPGAMWPAPELLIGESAEVWKERLSPQYWREHAETRPPLFVKLPDGTEFPIDGVVSKGDSGWRVSGDPPEITVNPSIHILTSRDGRSVTIWHGWLRAGVLTSC